MTGYIDSAVEGVLLTAPELKTSAKGTRWLRVLLVAGDGDAKQFCWVCAFGEDAERVAVQAHKGDKLYAEGTMTSEIYVRNGQPTVSLTVKARRVELLGQIGKRRPKQNRNHADRGKTRNAYDRSADYHRRVEDDWGRH